MATVIHAEMAALVTGLGTGSVISFAIRSRETLTMGIVNMSIRVRLSATKAAPSK
jgi:hypothetical protein